MPHSFASETRHAIAPRDELDDLFYFDPSADDAAQVHGSGENEVAQAQQNTHQALNNEDLGIDEEIKVRKARAPVAKLDEDRLLASNGLPKIRRISKESLRFRGKGHEFSDISRLLNTYQLWLDDFFPKAKFADGLAIIEKLGHKKRIQLIRKAWIDEGKRANEDNSDSNIDDDFVDISDRVEENMADNSMDVQGDTHVTNGTNSRAKPSPEDRQQRPNVEENDLDLYSATPPARSGLLGLGMTVNEGEAQPGVDELDALLADGAGRDLQATDAIITNGAVQVQSKPPNVDDFADDEEAMAEMGGMW